MIKWLKFTFGSFFSNKLSKEAKTRSLWNFVFAILFSFIIMLSFVTFSMNMSFNTHYQRATDFKEVTSHLFYNADEAKALNLKVVEPGDNAKVAAFFGEDSSQHALINTFENEEDKQKYGSKYNIVVDTRPSDTTFVEFEIKYVNKTDEVYNVTADGYRELSSSDRENYTADIKLTTNIVDITDEMTNMNKTWLNEYFSKMSDDDKSNSSLYDDYEKVLENETKEGYYDIYTRAYYSLNTTPTIVSYYQNTYAIIDEEDGSFVYSNYMIITDVWALVSFTNDLDINITYDGFYTNLADDFIIHTPQTYSKDVVVANVDTLINEIYDSASFIKAIYNGISIFRFMPYILLSLVVIPLFSFGICKIKKHSYANRFLDAFKISSSHLIISSAFSGIIAFIISFFVDSSTIFMTACWGALLILVIRQFAFVIAEEAYIKKNPEVEVINVTPTTTNVNNTAPREKVVLDNKPIDMKSKVIKNENVDEDEDETMDFM